MVGPESPEDAVSRLKALCDPSAEHLPDGVRLTQFVHASLDAIAEIERLQIRIKDLEGDEKEADPSP